MLTYALTHSGSCEIALCRPPTPSRSTTPSYFSAPGSHWPASMSCSTKREDALVLVRGRRGWNLAVLYARGVAAKQESRSSAVREEGRTLRREFQGLAVQLPPRPSVRSMRRCAPSG
eukprot:3662804-Rhodomonas_salina.7